MELTLGRVAVRDAGEQHQGPAVEAGALDSLLASINATKQARPGGKIVLFSSTHPGEGKTTVIRELVRYLTRRQQHRIAIIDGGARHDLASQLSVSESRDFSYVVASAGGGAVAAPMSRPTVVKLNPDVLAGSALVLGPENVRLLCNVFDYVLVEMPSVIEAPMAALHAQNFDGVILVIECGRTRWPAIQDAKGRFERAGARIIGAFLNKRDFVIPRRVYGAM